VLKEKEVVLALPVSWVTWTTPAVPANSWAVVLPMGAGFDTTSMMI